MTNAIISVVLPMYNAERYVGEAIESVLAQKYDPLELIVVNDGSTDDSERVVKSFPEVTYIYKENGGVSSARNAGLAVATGEIITFIDADDVWPAQKLAVQKAFLDANPHVQIVIGRTQFVFMQGAQRRKSGDGVDIYVLTSVFVGSGLFRRSAFDAVGNFDTGIRGGEDVDWFIRAAEQEISLETIPTVTLYRRLHDENMTNAYRAMRVWLMRAIKQSLDRRRANGIHYSGKILDWVELHPVENGESE